MPESNRFIIPWEKNLEIDHGWIDQQHKQMLKLVTDFTNTLAAGKSQAMVLKTFRFLHQYVDMHFSAEERCMQQYRYPGLTQHHKEHVSLTLKVEELRRQLDSTGNTGAIDASIGKLLWNWVKEHIKNTDRNFADYLHQMNITSPQQPTSSPSRHHHPAC